MIIAIIIILAFAMIVAIIYNKMIANRNRMQEAWSGTDVFLKKRHDLIPNLVETVKGYGGHEKSVFKEVVEARSEAMKSVQPESKIESETKLSRALNSLVAIAESYPDLKANVNFQQLQNQLSELEGELERSRRYYNGTVRENNTYIESFPMNILAGIFNFSKGNFLETDSSEKATPKVSF